MGENSQPSERKELGKVLNDQRKKKKAHQATSPRSNERNQRHGHARVPQAAKYQISRISAN
jgi:hypothetical protein